MEYNSFWDYLSSMTSRDWDDLVFSHRVDLLEEAFSLLDIIPSRGKTMHGGEHRKFIGAMLKAIVEDEPFIMPSRNINEWLPYGSSSAVGWIDAMADKGLLTYDKSTRLLKVNDLLKQLSQPTMTLLEL